MGEVVDIDAPFFGPITPEKVLKGAMAQNLREVVVIGETQDGTVFLSSTTGEAPKIFWLCACAKRLTMDAVFIEVEE
jgi:hypothetical protein